MAEDEDKRMREFASILTSCVYHNRNEEGK
jgi:hypothetical protein